MQVLESRFQLNDERVWFGKAKLLADRIVLKGLGYHRRIMLADIVEVRWAADDLVLVCGNGEEIDMTIKAATLWRYELQARCGLKNPDKASASESALPPVPRTPVSEKRSTALLDEEGRLVEEKDGLRGSGSGQDDGEMSAESERLSGDQTDLFLQKESTYRIRSGFAEDRPQHPKRAEDSE